MKDIAYVYFEKLNPSIGKILTASKKLQKQEDEYNLEYRIYYKNKKFIFSCYDNITNCIMRNYHLHYGYDCEKNSWRLRGKIFQVEMIDIADKFSCIIRGQKIKIIKEIKNTDYYIKAANLRTYSFNKTVKDLPEKIELFYVLKHGKKEEELVYIPPEKRELYKDCKVVGHHYNFFAKIAPKEFKAQILADREKRREENLKKEFEKFKNSNLCYKYFMSLYSPYLFYNNHDKLRTIDWDHFNDYEIMEFESALYDQDYLDKETYKCREKFWEDLYERFKIF